MAPEFGRSRVNRINTSATSRVTGEHKMQEVWFKLEVHPMLRASKAETLRRNVSQIAANERDNLTCQIHDQMWEGASAVSICESRRQQAAGPIEVKLGNVLIHLIEHPRGTSIHYTKKLSHTPSRRITCRSRLP